MVSNNFITLLLFTVGAVYSVKIEFAASSGRGNFRDDGPSWRSGLGNKGFIPLPWIPTRSPALAGACTDTILTTSCQCGPAICAPGQYCTDIVTANTSICNTPAGCPVGDIETELPCTCGSPNKVCTIGQVCTGNECVTPQPNCPVGNVITPALCKCGTSICTTNQYCTAATSTCDEPELSSCSPGISPPNKPCTCGSTAAVCSTGQKCISATPGPDQVCSPANFCNDNDTECLCGIEACIPGQTCQGQKCDPPICLATLVPTDFKCMCAGVECDLGQTCDQSNVAIPCL